MWKDCLALIFYLFKQTTYGNDGIQQRTKSGYGQPVLFRMYLKKISVTLITNISHKYFIHDMKYFFHNTSIDFDVFFFNDFQISQTSLPAVQSNLRDSLTEFFLRKIPYVQIRSNSQNVKVIFHFSQIQKHESCSLRLKKKLKMYHASVSWSERMREILLKLSQENMSELSNVLIAILALSVEKIVNIRLLGFR